MAASALAQHLIDTGQVTDEAPPVGVDERLAAEVLALEEQVVERSRHDPAVFCAYTLRDEETGLPVKSVPLHREWHALANAHPRLLLWAFVESGKTQQLSIGRAIWELGKNPNLRIVVVSNTIGQAQKIVTTVARYIEKSPEVHKVFPHLKRDRARPWNMSQLFVERTSLGKDPSFQACGIHGNIYGARIDLLIYDDILDYENTLTHKAREELHRWVQATLEGRLTQNARAWCIGNAWHRDDLMHRFSRSGVWYSVRYTVANDNGESLWEDRWPAARIKEKSVILGPIESGRQLYSRAISDEEAKFKREYIEHALARGANRSVTRELRGLPAGFATFTGVDLGVKQQERHDVTSMFTILVYPNEDREVLMCEAGKWTGPDIITRIVDTHRRYHSIVMVEDNAAQDFILQFARDQSAVPLQNFNTNKKTLKNPLFGLESLAVEFANKKWIIPSRNGRPLLKSLVAWIDEMLFYDPQAHIGDRLMSSWFARECARTHKAPVRPSRHAHNIHAR